MVREVSVQISARSIQGARDVFDECMKLADSDRSFNGEFISVPERDDPSKHNGAMLYTFDE